MVGGSGMTAYDIIKSKKDGKALTEDEIRFFVNGLLSGEIPDSQAAALLMAISFKGMNGDETSSLARTMAESGKTLDLSVLPGEACCMHSTGAVGNKTALVVAPVVAACGVRTVIMSDRGSLNIGGTADKLLSIPGMRVDFRTRELLSTVSRYGLCFAEMSGEAAPAEKKLSSLRDNTATMDSIPLTAASVMSEKIASGTKKLVLDVNVGSGAHITNVKDAKRLAREMVSIGAANGISVTALVTDNNSPLGYAVGNSLEVIEAVNTLNGVGPEDLTELCLTLSAHMLHLCGKGTFDECLEAAKNAIFSGLAFERFVWAVNAQGGDSGVLTDTSLFRKARYYRTLTAKSSGYITSVDAGLCGRAAAMLGAARRRSDDIIDMAAGVMLEQKPGAFVKSGDIIATLYAEDERLFDDAEREILAAFEISGEPKETAGLIIDKVTNKD